MIYIVSIEEKLSKIEFEKQQRGKLMRGGESDKKQSTSAPLVKMMKE
jgi:hypothetical protein